MSHTHVCEDCSEEYHKPNVNICPICYGELLEQIELEVIEK